MAIRIIKLLELNTIVKSCQAIFLEGSAGHTVVQSRSLDFVNEYLGIDHTIKHQSHFGTGSVGKA